MNIRQSRLGRFVVLTVVVSMPLLGMAGVASAKATKATPKVCAKHPNKKKCASSTGGGSGSGGSSPQITVEVDPNPLVETGQSEIHAVIQVETLPSFAGDEVNIDSSQLNASCASVSYETDRTNSPMHSWNNIGTFLDDDGNATVVVDALDCAPGTSTLEADLEVAPFLTALTTLVALPPAVTPEGLTGFPNNEVETGDTSVSGDSDVYAVFYVETNPVYAEQEVEISSAQLEARCIIGWIWEAGNNGQDIGPFTGVNTGPDAHTILDDDGNAIFVFKGASCAAGDAEVIADVLAGTHQTYTFDYTVDPPAPTI